MLKHLYQCPLRWSDMDVYGVINNVVYLRYLEEARVSFVHLMTEANGDAFFKDGSVVVRHEITYLHKLSHRLEPLGIEIWVTDLNSATVTVAYELKDDDHVYATASTVMAPFVYATDRPRRLTVHEQNFFCRYLNSVV